jgi:hypothetical protein
MLSALNCVQHLLEKREIVSMVLPKHGNLLFHRGVDVVFKQSSLLNV